MGYVLLVLQSQPHVELVTSGSANLHMSGKIVMVTLACRYSAALWHCSYVTYGIVTSISVVKL